MGLEEVVWELEQKITKIENSLATFYSSLALLALEKPSEFRACVCLLAGEAHNELRGLDREFS